MAASSKSKRRYCGLCRLEMQGRHSIKPEHLEDLMLHKNQDTLPNALEEGAEVCCRHFEPHRCKRGVRIELVPLKEFCTPKFLPLIQKQIAPISKKQKTSTTANEAALQNICSLYDEINTNYLLNIEKTIPSSSRILTRNARTPQPPSAFQQMMEALDSQSGIFLYFYILNFF